MLTKREAKERTLLGWIELAGGPASTPDAIVCECLKLRLVRRSGRHLVYTLKANKLRGRMIAEVAEVGSLAVRGPVVDVFLMGEVSRGRYVGPIGTLERVEVGGITIAVPAHLLEEVDPKCL